MTRAVPHACLVILDGWGIAPPGPGNAIALAATPVFDQLWARYPRAELEASGAAVGLPQGQMGNSEVGHLTIGAGTIVKQELTRIDEAAAAGGFAQNEVLRAALSGSERVHLLGLTSSGGVHSSLAHLLALIDLAADVGVPDLVLHCFTDGRDTSPTSGAGFLATVAEHCERTGAGRIASVVGRYWAMDRDNRWDRTQKAYNLLVRGFGERHATSATTAAAVAYKLGETDEFIHPTSIGLEGRIRPDDSVLCFNFRPDRMRQLVRALADPELSEIDRRDRAPVARLTTMTVYREDFPYPAAFAPVHPPDTLAATVARAGESQLHVAETEKYAHVTYFLGGGREQPQPGERRELVPSVRSVPTYDLAPAMSAYEIVDAFRRAFAEQRPRLSVINFANADMVGHTGVLPAAIRAVEVVDTCLGEVVAEVSSAGGVCVITADHGNAEHMLDGDDPDTAHSTNPVPLIVTLSGAALAAAGGLSDVAPTVLDVLGIGRPAGMTGHSLLIERDRSAEAA
ncbi:MAG TPA: 2,3-bisphosphoglycerate-independent phosphoglycerate mutase [Solirubrobacteraceae bacterium]|nr:2,3-bisphosphoglycerate-independent phosphoglycerate mutase [Solirubrobacteraceae bacterium]